MADSAASHTGLDPQDWSATRALGHRMLDDMIDWLAAARERPVWQRMPDEKRAELRAPLPRAGVALDEIYADFQRLVLPYGAANEHPRMMGWVNGGGNAAGILAELLTAVFNPNCAGRDHAAIEMERQVVTWAAEMVGMPAATSGGLLAGSSMANMVAVLVARRAALGAGVRSAGLAGSGPDGGAARLVAYASAAAHGCIPRALDMAGIGSDALRLVPADAQHRMDVGALRAAVAADRAAGLQPFLVVGTAGTVDCGAIDDLAGVADVAAAAGLWFHVDGAFGATAALSARFRPLLAGIERADSLAFDFHKWMQVPYDAGCVLVRDPVMHLATFAQDLAYLTYAERGMAGNPPWPRDLGPDLSREFRALKIWMTLRAYGADGLAGVVENGCAVARHLAARVAREPALELLAPVTLNIVCFRVKALSDAENRDLVADLQEAGIAAPSTTVIAGRLAIRAALFNHRTTTDDADALVDGVLALPRTACRQVMCVRSTADRSASLQSMPVPNPLKSGQQTSARRHPGTKVFCFFFAKKKAFLTETFRSSHRVKRALLLTTLLTTPAFADQPQPQPLPMPAAIPAPQDVAYPGTIQLTADVTDLARHVVSVHEVIPVQHGGDVVLLYPEWVPGDHGPTGPLAALAGLDFKAGGQSLTWVRDTVDVHAFHVQVPQDAASIDVHFQYLSPPTRREGRVEMTPDIVNLAWNELALYPAGVFTRDVSVSPSLVLPKGWHYATALDTQAAGDGHAQFRTVPFNTLVDSPFFAGRYSARIDLAPGAAVPVHLNVFADKPQDLVITPDQLAKHRALVTQAKLLYGSQHYGHYDFLFALSSQLGGIGLEHHQSSEDGEDRNYFSDWDKAVAGRDLLAHEYTHSWNGKFRRPADLWAPNFNVPERDSLLWVYEGQTQFWGHVLAARSGLWSRQDALDAIALDAASMEREIGRAWRPLEDTTNDPIINERRPQSWHSWERQEDYYVEGLLIWLDADTLIRQQTHGQKSLGDFAHAFFGVDDGSFVTLPYKFEDVVAALNGVMPYDWAGFLRTRLDRRGGTAPLDGITRGGYRLVYTDKPSDFQKSEDSYREAHDFSASIGLLLGKDATISGVIWDSPAYRAGLAKGGKILAINGLAVDEDNDLQAAIKLAHTDKAPIELLVQDDMHFRMVQVPYHDGLRYPHLERVAGTPALLDDLLAPLK